MQTAVPGKTLSARDLSAALQSTDRTMTLSTASALRARINLSASARDSPALRRVGAARPSRRALRCPGSFPRTNNAFSVRRGRLGAARASAGAAAAEWVVEPSPADPSCPFDWWKDAVVYQIFPDRFAPDPAGHAPGISVDAWGSPPTIRSFQGGSLRGITANLDHIQSLGVNTLYTTPVFLSTANHRYHPSDFMKVDPMLGGEDAFRELVEACHARGMRFVLDGVFNHTGRGHWAFASLLDAQEQSPYADWFLPKSFPVVAYGVERYNVNYECWWDLPDLPKLNFNNEGVREHVLDVGAFWVREFGIDGWRLDYPIEIEPKFWKRFRDRCRAEKEGCVTVGELFGVKPDDVGEDGHFDSLMNYAFGTCAVGFVGGGVELRQDDAIGGDYQITSVDADGFRKAYGEVCRAYQSAHVPGVGRDARGTQNALGKGSAHPAMLMNLFDSHDTARALWMLRGDAEALKLLLLMQACVPGPPMVYQGTEVGQIGALGLDGSGRDPHNRQAFPWHESVAWDRNLLSHSKEVGRLRNELYALRRGGLRWCATHSEIANEGEPVDDTKLIAWERAFASSSDGAGAVCAFHSDKNKTTSATLIDTGFGANVPVKAAFATKGVVLGSATDAEGRVSVTFPPQSGVVVVPA